MLEFDPEDAGTCAGTAGTGLEENTDALRYLQSIYRNPMQSTGMRMRAAMAALPFEAPKLAVTTNAPWTDSLADALDRALQRSQVKLIEHQPAPAQPAPIPPHGTLRQGPTPDRRFRRS
jgi:hypothetical protein